MRVRSLAPPSSHLIQTWLPRLLFAIGLLCLGYVAYVLVDARIFEWVQKRRFEAAVAARGQASPPGVTRGAPGPQAPAPPAAAPGGAPAGGSPAGVGAAGAPPAAQTDRLDAFRSSPEAPAPAEGTVLGRIEIPRIRVSSLLLEGTEPSTLRHGAGHIPDTALPDRPGNVGVAAHRDSFFRGLKDIQKNDLIKVVTLAGAAEYRVDWTRIVEPEDVEVLNATPDPELTLVTCYPFYYIGSAPHRFIVRAHRVDPAVPGAASPAGAGQPAGH